MKPASAFVVSVARGLAISGILIMLLPIIGSADSLRFAMPILELVVTIYGGSARITRGMINRNLSRRRGLGGFAERYYIIWLGRCNGGGILPRGRQIIFGSGIWCWKCKICWKIIKSYCAVFCRKRGWLSVRNVIQYISCRGEIRTAKDIAYWKIFSKKFEKPLDKIGRKWYNI